MTQRVAAMEGCAERAGRNGQLPQDFHGFALSFLSPRKGHFSSGETGKKGFESFATSYDVKIMR